MVRIALLIALVIPAATCGIIGPSCGGEEGVAATLTGEIAAGAVVVHTVPYDTRGSQNDGDLEWEGRALADGPRLQMLITGVGCNDLDPADPKLESRVGEPCMLLARGGSREGFNASFIITHGRGNPLTLGTPAEYKVWIVGDPKQRTRYTLMTTWRLPVDC